MGSSFICYRDRGFWTRDADAELLLYLLAEEVDGDPASPGWLRRAREDWHLHATVGFMGCVSASLDQHLGADPDRVNAVLALAGQVRRRVAASAPAIAREVVNGFGTGGDGSYFAADVPTEPLLRIVDAFAALLRGELTWTML